MRDMDVLTVRLILIPESRSMRWDSAVMILLSGNMCSQPRNLLDYRNSSSLRDSVFIAEVSELTS